MEVILPSPRENKPEEDFKLNLKPTFGNNNMNNMNLVSNHSVSDGDSKHENLDSPYRKRFQNDKIKKEIKYKGEKKLELTDQHVKNFLRSLTNILETTVKNKIKKIDLVILVFLIIKVLLCLYENNYFTSLISHVECKNDNSTKSLRYLQSSNDTSIISNSSVSSPSNPSQIIPSSPNCPLGEITIIDKPEYEENTTDKVLRFIILGVVVILEILLFIRYRLEMNLLRATSMACSSDGFFSTGKWKYFLLEFLIFVIFTPPGLNGTFNGRMIFGYYIYSYNSIILFFSLFKIYYLLRIYWNYSIWTSDKITELSHEYRIPLGASFALKSLLKQRPYLFIILLLGSCIGIYGFMMRIFEYGYVSDANAAVGAKSIKNPNFKSYTDTFWVIVITMMTIGYGDIYPSTHLGRVIAFFSAVSGMFIVSLLIVSLSHVVEFSPEEKKAHNLIRKYEAYQKMRNYAISYLKALAKLYLIKKSSRKIDPKKKKYYSLI
jgi:hypothetical protein